MQLKHLLQPCSLLSTSFGNVWQCFDQQCLVPGDAERVFGDYFSTFPWEQLQVVTDLIALTVYWPLSLLAALAESAGLHLASFPRSYYRNCSYYTLRTDARDRGTLKQSFSLVKIREMCAAAGLVDLRFSSHRPFGLCWVSRLTTDVRYCWPVLPFT